MKHTIAIWAGAFLAISTSIAQAAFAHPGHEDAEAHNEPAPAQTLTIRLAKADDANAGTTGQGDLVFRLLYHSSHLPAEAQAVLVNAHGGFAVDRREGKGEIYFALPGAGLIQISRDLTSTRMIPTADEAKNVTLHNTTIWYGKSGAPYLILPSPDGQKVFTTTLSGQLLNTLSAPTADERFEAAAVNEYFAGGERLIPTDAEYLNGLYYITTGYSKLDYVLTAKVESESPFKASWGTLAFGGKGDEPGQFGTGHGITVVPGGKSIAVADRPNSEVEIFSPEGKLEGALTLPKGSFPCDVDYVESYKVVGCLHGPDREKGAPIYIVKGNDVVSTLMIKEDLGLETFQHIHNAVMVKRNGKLYVVAQAWNPGDFAILEQANQ